MKETKLFFGLCVSALLSLGTLTACGAGGNGADEYDEKGRLILNMKNVYWEGFDGSDTYTEELNEKFGIHVKASNYDYAEWDGMVNTAINGNNLTDVFHFNLKAYNFGSTYEKWVDGQIVKALPDDLSKWPHLQEMLSHVSNLDALKVDGKLYGIPIMNDIVNYQKDFSNFTYIYRRDWAKAIDAAHQGQAGYPVYREGDVYTWEEFNNLMAAFKANPIDEKTSVLVDESWGFPSVTNFYKDVPHCFAKDENGKAINAFTSDKYVAGLEKAKEFVSTKKFYSQDQFNFAANKAKEIYKGDQAAIFYDNFSLANYITLRDEMRPSHQSNLDDATAFLKIKGPDGKFALEGTENWFSMTLFNYDISDLKMGKILDLIDYLLSEEGTKLAVYGKEGYDYNMVGDEVVLSEKGWEKDQYGNYIAKTNGAKLLRYMATLGNDTKSYDPLTKMDAYNLLSAWQNEMKAAKEAGNLRIVKEPADIDWMSTPTKNDKTEAILADANTFVLKYAFNQFASLDAYKAEFDKDPSWARILNEINERLGK